MTVRGWRIRGMLSIEETPEGLASAYTREVGWAQGFRINVDARLILLGVQRMLTEKLLRESDLRHAAVVLGCRLGAMDSYEAFDDSLVDSQPTPLAFAYALPSTPVASASVRYGLRGITYTLVGQDDVGLRALRQGIGLVTSGRAQRAVIGCWETPSQTAQRVGWSTMCRLLLAIVEPDDEPCASPWLVQRDADCSANTGCITMLRACLNRIGGRHVG